MWKANSHEISIRQNNLHLVIVSIILRMCAFIYKHQLRYPLLTLFIDVLILFFSWVHSFYLQAVTLSLHEKETKAKSKIRLTQG